MHLALMSSENRAAHALGSNYPGGLPAMVSAMNAKAAALGMHSAHFVDPCGLSSQNVASPEDLSKLVIAASKNPTIREFSTDPNYSVRVHKHLIEFRKSGKPSICYLGYDGVSNPEYYLASACQQVWVVPQSSVIVHGMMAQALFMRGTLDIGSIRAEPADRSANEMRMPGAHRLGIDPQSPRGGGPETVDHHVGIRRECIEHGGGLALPQIERHASLVSVEALEVRVATVRLRL